MKKDEIEAKDLNGQSTLYRWGYETNGKGVGFDIANGCSTTRSILHGYFNPLVFWY